MTENDRLLTQVERRQLCAFLPPRATHEEELEAMCLAQDAKTLKAIIELLTCELDKRGY